MARFESLLEHHAKAPCSPKLGSCAQSGLLLVVKARLCVMPYRAAGLAAPYRARKGSELARAGAPTPPDREYGGGFGLYPVDILAQRMGFHKRRQDVCVGGARASPAT